MPTRQVARNRASAKSGLKWPPVNPRANCVNRAVRQQIRPRDRNKEGNPKRRFVFTGTELQDQETGVHEGEDEQGDGAGGSSEGDEREEEGEQEGDRWPRPGWHERA